VSSNGAEGPAATLQGETEAARKRAAVETYVRHEALLRRTARRFSLCADDADDALQRALEIMLTKAPSADPRELIRWTQTVVKHEALSVRRERERIFSGPAATPAERGREDWVAQIPADADGPDEQVARREQVARSREALQSLKPQELRALALLAEGYSYREIGEITGFSQTKVNRCLAEGRERFRRFLASSEDGSRCAEMGPLLSAFCDGELGGEQEGALREHLRACSSCRAALRAYRAAPRAVAALAPGLALERSLFERVHDALAGLASRFGGGADSALPQIAAGSGGGAAALAKVAAVCVGAAAGTAACVATGVVPAPLEVAGERAKAPALERPLDPSLVAGPGSHAGPAYEPESSPSPQPAPDRDRDETVRGRDDLAPAVQPAPAPEPASAGAVEYTPPVAPEPAPAPTPVEPSRGDEVGGPAGEFGP
jgi:RNA polymerase sigma factor (sigma-70 family)